MKTKWDVVVSLALTFSLSAWGVEAIPDGPGWISLFDGKTLTGWKVGKNAETFRVEDGAIVANGNVAHLFYVGDVNHHMFKNFDLKMDVMTYPHANSGIYFHTQYQEEGFPKFGVECQVNNSHSDWRRTGGLYGVSDLRETPVKDNVWYTQEIVVQGLHVTVKLNDKTVLEYAFPNEADGKPFPLGKKLYLPEGTIAFQGHDPGSKVCFKNIRIKILD